MACNRRVGLPFGLVHYNFKDLLVKHDSVV